MFDIDLIEKKKKNLLSVGELLKKEFIGLDEVIDRIISLMEVWYTFPELLTHPVIINLWGMTGVGKTDLIRKLVSKLDFRENYLEVQLTSGGDKYDSIQSKLLGLNITSNKQAILLLDEIQRFSTINENGEIIRDSGYTDIWELLSDGSFSNAFQEKYELQMYLYELLYDKDARENVSEDEQITPDSKKEVEGPKQKSEKERKFKNYIWSATRFKKLTETSLSVEEVMQLTLDQQIETILEKLESLNKNQERKKYNNLLIFICGNIDEAYSMSSSVSDVDTDADVLHERTKRITLLEIKDALLKKYRPEQIARLGNNHIIYSSLSKRNFQDLIRRCLDKVSAKFYTVSKVKINFADNIYDVIYKNGVFPSQGVRPVFSTVNSLVENPLPEFLLQALKKDCSEIDLAFNAVDSTLVCTFKENVLTKKIQLDIDSLKDNITKDTLALVSAHEIGHVLTYMLLFKTVPIQVCCDAVNFSEGFVIPHNIRQNKEYLLNTIQVLLAGKVAEELVFGDIYTGTGTYRDLSQATRLACEMVRVLNMDGTVGVIAPHVAGHPSCVTVTSVSETNPIVEQILREQKVKTTDLLAKNSKLFKTLVCELLNKKKLMSEEIYLITQDQIPGLEQISLKETIEHTYSSILKKYLDG